MKMESNYVNCLNKKEENLLELKVVINGPIRTSYESGYHKLKTIFFCFNFQPFAFVIFKR